MSRTDPLEAAGDPSDGWFEMTRIEDVGGSVDVVIQALQTLQPERLVYAEGDSWFDKFTPIGQRGTNLLEAIRTPFRTAVVDVSHIGDEASEMVSGQQARQTRAMFNLFSFNAILLSAGGNDLRKVLVDLVASRVAAARVPSPEAHPAGTRSGLEASASPTQFFDAIVADIARFVALRSGARDAVTRAAPIFVHGYDHLQPRPAGAALFTGSRIGAGPWLYPTLRDAGLDDMQMRAAADEVIDELNRQLASKIAPLPNVHVIDQRGVLTPARAGTTGSDADWLDEIHPNAGGFDKLARQRWNVPLARALGWAPARVDGLPATVGLRPAVVRDPADSVATAGGASGREPRLNAAGARTARRAGATPPAAR